MKINNLTKLFICLMTPLLFGFLGSLVTIKEIAGWYVNLKKPGLVPPNNVFGPVWTTLYLMIGLAGYYYWISKSKKKATGLAIFGIQLFLNFLWSVLFFGLHSPALAIGEIILLVLAISININMFWKSSKTAGLLLLPYLIWVLFASYLTYGVWKLN